jgi:P27 family predicted phage terminase small subunit
MTKRKPVELKILSGTNRPRGVRADLLAALPRAPARLNAAAKEHWARVGTVAVRASLIGEADLEVLALLCQALADADAAGALIEREGVTIVSGEGVIKANPAIGVLRDARQLSARLLSELGMSPRSREAVAPAPVKPWPPVAETKGGADDESDDLDAYLSERKAAEQ